MRTGFYSTNQTNSGEIRPSGVFLAHPTPMGGTTGVSLEQGLGLTDISRGRPGRRPGDECSSSPDYYFIIDENKSGSPPGSICLFLGFLVPRSPWMRTPLFVKKQDHTSATCALCFSTPHPTTSKTLLGFGLLGCSLSEG